MNLCETTPKRKTRNLLEIVSTQLPFFFRFSIQTEGCIENKNSAPPENKPKNIMSISVLRQFSQRTLRSLFLSDFPIDH